MTSTDSSSKTLTVLFTDVVGSTRLWETAPDAMRTAIERHDSLLREVFEHFQGRVIKSTGDGLMAVFSTASDAVKACIGAQERLQGEQWDDQVRALSVRMGMHAGELPTTADDYLGQTVNRAARIMSVAHGGQILASRVVVSLAEPGLPDGAGFRDLGEHRLKDLLRPEQIFQVTYPSIPGEYPPIATLSRRPNNLPTQVSEFLGRGSELTALRDLLHQNSVRLLTITGPGGIGKTRLGLQVAADQIEQFEDGVFFVDLSSARDPDEVFDAIIRTLDLPHVGEESSLGALTRGLTAQRILLVLDNFEQVVAAAGDLSELLQHCPGLTVMVTSREALRVRGEHLFSVPPLALPNVKDLLSLEAAGESEAVQLFVERASEAHPGFKLTDENASVVAEICFRLDGLPLAIELAAARTRLFSPIELRDRLLSRLELLSGGPRDAPARHQTLRSTIEWSYDLLGDQEKAMLEVLSVFSSPRLEAVEEVTARLEQLRDLEVVDLISSLVDKSLIRSLDTGSYSRISMLETIREFAIDRLDIDPEFGSTVRNAHAEYYAEFASSQQDVERATALDDLESELSDLTAAWQHWIAANEMDKLEPLYDALWDLHQVRGWYRDAIDLTRDMLTVLDRSPPSSERARKEVTLQTSLARGLLATSGYTREVEEIYQRALTLSEETGHLPLRFPALRSLASFHLFRGEFDRTASLGAEFLALAEREHDARLQVEGHFLLGSSLAFQGHLDTGLEHLETAIARFDPNQQSVAHFRLGANPGIAAQTTLALLLWLLGYPDRAEKRAQAAIGMARQVDHPFTLAYALFHVSFLYLWHRDWDHVRTMARDLLELSDRYDYQIWKALAVILEGLYTVSMGNTKEGLDHADQGIAMYEGLKTPPVFWPLVLYLHATGLALARQPRQGLTLMEEAIDIAGQGFLYPEFALLKGDLAALASLSTDAEEAYRAALAVAGDMGMRMSQLRAATRLARMSRPPKSVENDLSVLLAIYETFGADRNTHDLREARSILDDAHV